MLVVEDAAAPVLWAWRCVVQVRSPKLLSPSGHWQAALRAKWGLPANQAPGRRPWRILGPSQGSLRPFVEAGKLGAAFDWRNSGKMCLAHRKRAS